jgi:maltose alpha-D-glucosyltransferase/alpha-amylase
MTNRRKENHRIEEEPLWYKDAIIYEVHVRAFFDSDGDGIGDFRGLTEKLDYLKNLGVNAIWVLPFYPSPLKDDGYDISDYVDIHPTYGNLSDFKIFLREAHRRGLRVITELILNHTSDQHSWFKRAREAELGDSNRNFYVWSDNQEQYKETRIIFKDFESSNWTWDSRAKAYFWHRFYSHQPDLNYDNPMVQKAILKTIDFWLELGVDGLRLDAVPYLFEREGTNCENLPETHQFLKKLRAHVDSKYKNRMLLGEANQWPEDAAAYFGTEDECHMAFHFPLMPRLFMAIRMEDRFPIIDILEQTPQVSETNQWALFLRNHDELTLEMVTDEERDYMYRVYASEPQMRVNLGIRRRLAPLLGSHRRRIELMNGLLLSLPGSPVLYYGDEIGMGDNIYLGDRNGVRTPMQWSADRNAGFSRANPQKLYLPIIIDPEYHFEAINVEAQEKNPHSLLWWMRYLISLRKRYKAFGRGTISFLYPINHKVIAFIRHYQEENILVVANLSRYVQCVELDLAQYKDMVPVELFGRTKFPVIGENPYFLTLGPHSFLWFSIEPKTKRTERIETSTLKTEMPAIKVENRIDAVFEEKAKARLEELLSNYFVQHHWFRGKAKHIKSTTIKEVVPINNAYLGLIQVKYTEGDIETYAVPFAYAPAKECEALIKEYPQSIITRIQFGTESGFLFDALFDKEFCQSLMSTIERRRHYKGLEGEVVGVPIRGFSKNKNSELQQAEISLIRTEQNNTSVVFDKKFILKFFRCIETGINPDWEIGTFLSQKNFSHVPPVAGGIQYLTGRDTTLNIAVLHDYIPNQGDAWQYTLESLSSFFVRVLTLNSGKASKILREYQTFNFDNNFIPIEIIELIGGYLTSVQLLGQRTAELHAVLASAQTPDFAPEPFSTLYQRSLYQSMRSLSRQVFQLLRHRLTDMSDDMRLLTQRILDWESKIIERFQIITKKKISAMRIRCHNDYHLGQVLYTGKDFVIIDFEGEPTRPLTERRIKRSALRDVAGMVRSFHYVAYSALLRHRRIRSEDTTRLEPWLELWYKYVSGNFIRSYLDVAKEAPFLPKDKEEFDLLLQSLLLEKAIYELGYELNYRPDWAVIPMRGIEYIMQEK